MEQLIGSLRQLVHLSRAARAAVHVRHCGDPLLACQRPKGKRHEVIVDRGTLGAQVVAHVIGHGSAPPPAKSWVALRARSFINPRRIRVLAVPRGTDSTSLTSAAVYP